MGANCDVCFRKRGGTRCKRCDEGFKRSKNRRACNSVDEGDEDDEDDSDPGITGVECKVANCNVCLKKGGGTRCKRCDAGFKRSNKKRTCSALEAAVDEEDVDDDGSAPDVTGAECTDIIGNCAVCFRRRGKTLCRRCDDGFKKSKNKKTCSATDEPAVEPPAVEPAEIDDKDAPRPQPCNVAYCAECGVGKRASKKCKTCLGGFTVGRSKKICTPNDAPEPAVDDIDDFDIDDEEDVDDDGSAPDIDGPECWDIEKKCAVCFRRRGKTLCRRCY